MQARTYLILVLAFLFSWSSYTASAQGGDSHPPKDWFHLDHKSDNYRGVSTKRLYDEFLKNRKSKTVIVAVIDSGVDWEHEDLDDVMWVNEDEIPNNGLDDDHNGYIDDVHGWNFIGGKGGDVSADNLELTRLYRKYHAKYGKMASNAGLSGKDKSEYARYESLKADYEKNRNKAKKSIDRYTEMKEGLISGIKAVKVALGDKELTLANVKALEAGSNEALAAGQGMMIEALMKNPSTTFKSLKSEVTSGIQGAINHFDGQYKHYYNADFDPRSIVGDNFMDQREQFYGNNNYEGPDALHGTHVAGIIGAERGNGIGMDGVADDVRIMTIRAVPDGDERDKDVANAIRYAVDNGASIVNMSFGKGFSWNKTIVDDAVKYAQKHDVLLVHAAGNSGQNNDNTDNFPNDGYEKRGLFSPKHSKTWVEVGALNFDQGEDTPAPFSNYGKDKVDLFAPGVQIYSTFPDNEYSSISGTSMAAPVVAGVAALLRSYYPDLSAKQVKEILITSTTPINDMVKTPGSPELKVPFSQLSVSGGTLNAYSAMKIADKTKGKKKKSKKSQTGSMKTSSSKKPRA